MQRPNNHSFAVELAAFLWFAQTQLYLLIERRSGPNPASTRLTRMSVGSDLRQVLKKVLVLTKLGVCFFSLFVLSWFVNFVGFFIPEIP